MTRLPGFRVALAVSVALTAIAPPAVAAEADDTAAVATAAAAAREPADRIPAGVIELDETVISGNQELPKVLYILPWQQPDGLPDIELRTEFAEVELFRRLYPPAYRRELSYFEASAAATDSKASDSKE
ncbi:MAG: hypothetical protein RIC56_12485 [Pseudomonadales bacterium]